MKAWNLNKVGKITLDEKPEPTPRPGWVLVKVSYCGICSSDIPRVFLKGTYHFPTVIGHEFSGIVVKTTTPETTHLQNKPVSVFPLIPCQKCPSCLKGSYETCSNYDYIGSRRDGAMAEYVAVPAWNLIELKSIADLKLCSLMEPLSVAIHAVKRAQLKKADRIAIIGTGMIGFAIALFAMSYGLREIVIFGRNDSKAHLASNLGLNFQTSPNNFISSFDVVFEAVGSSIAINSGINLLNTEGRLILLGNPDGDIRFNQDVYWKILRKQLHVLGTWNSHYSHNSSSDWTDSLKFIIENRKKLNLLITHIFSSEQLLTALDIMRFKKDNYCKILIKW